MIRASDGTPLLERRAFGTLAAIVERAALVTPNLDGKTRPISHSVRNVVGDERADRNNFV